MLDRRAGLSKIDGAEICEIHATFSVKRYICKKKPGACEPLAGLSLMAVVSGEITTR